MFVSIRHLLMGQTLGILGSKEEAYLTERMSKFSLARETRPVVLRILDSNIGETGATNVFFLISLILEYFLYLQKSHKDTTERSCVLLTHFP